jgi:hypothetical protein
MTIVAHEPVPGMLMRLVTEGLKAQGFSVHLPEQEDERRVTVERWGGQCDLSVGDSGFVEWECVPWASGKADPRLTADIAAFLLAGKDEDSPRQGGGYDPRGLSFKGITGNELRARGFDVSLEVYEDNELLEAFTEIVVTNPVIHPGASVRITNDGAVAWECDYPCEAAATTGTPEYPAVLADPARLADSIVATVAHAISLSSGKPDSGPLSPRYTTK